MTGRIFNIQRYSIHDGGGIRTIVFLKGCPLSCVWCSNPESQKFSKEILFDEKRCLNCKSCFSACKYNAICEGKSRVNLAACKLCKECLEVCYTNALRLAGEDKNVEEIVEEIKKDRPFYMESGGGITLSGGEPASQWQFAAALLDACKNEGIHTAMETCGYAPEKNFLELAKRLDLLLYDIKHINDEMHKKITGVGNEQILKNAKAAAEITKQIIVRIPVIPHYTDSKENIEGIASFVANLQSIEEIHLLPYHCYARGKYTELGREYPLSELMSPSKEYMEELVRLVEKHGLKAKIGG